MKRQKLKWLDNLLILQGWIFNLEYIFHKAKARAKEKRVHLSSNVYYVIWLSVVTTYNVAIRMADYFYTLLDYKVLRSLMLSELYGITVCSR